MIGLDTDVVLRYILQDDPRQSALATELLESLTPASPGFVSMICLSELYWVLDHTCKLSRAQISAILQALLITDSLVLENANLVSQAHSDYSTGSADFDDCLIAQCALAAECDSIYTFDQTAAKSGVMRLLS